MKINPSQNKQLHFLLHQTQMISHKADLVLAFTGGRSESSRELLATEAQQLISYLKGLDITSPTGGGREGAAANQMRRKILAMCHRIDWKTEDGKADIDRLNGWCRSKSYLKKDLNYYTYNELPKLVTEFQKVYKYYISKTIK